MLKKRLCILPIIAALLFCYGCADIHAYTPNDHYATQQPLSAIEYSIYMNKQITIFANQLTARMGASASRDSVYNHEISSVQDSIDLLERVRNEVEGTYPSEGNDSYRESVLNAMNIAIQHMKEYKDTLAAGMDVSNYPGIFLDDFTELTSLASLYAD